ncbi:MAG: BMP family ABC transporter substrate-binding protein [Clostridiales bacterium]|nr:BMP family ABC transporter substrate-binding protein [Clostridiales bacterium]
MRVKLSFKFFLCFFLLVCFVAVLIFGNKKKKKQFEIALVTDTGSIDDKSFTQGAWNGIIEYAEKNNIGYKYYQPINGNEDSLLSNIDIAVRGGAKLIIATGFLNELAIYRSQDKYNYIKFVLVDGIPNDGSDFKTGENTISLSYAEDEAGFLAGYFAVKDGYKKLGFMGGAAMPPVIKYGYGFVQGAEFASKELNLQNNEVEIKYYYTGEFKASPEFQAMATSWYNNSTEIIFACGGALGNSVMAAAESLNKKVIGVDIDQSSESETVITSALKHVKSSVFECVKDYHTGNFPGGENLVFCSKNDGIGLEIKNSRFKNFDNDDYEKILNLLKDKKIELIENIEESGSPSIIKTNFIKITEIK